MRKRGPIATAWAVVMLLLATSTATPAELVGVSPGVSLGSRAATSEIGTICPTFSWTSSPSEQPVHLAVFEIPTTEAEDADRLESANDPALEAILPAGAVAWTVPFDRCLERGRKYAWAVRAMADEPSRAWSEPMLFRVAIVPSMAEVRAALEVLRASRETAVEADEEPEQALDGTTPDLRGARLPALAPAPDETALTAEPTETTDVVVGILGKVDSQGAGSAGLIGESDAGSGEVYGVVGLSASTAGAAGLFENTAGGVILAGYNNGNEVFRVEGDGTLHATTYAGPGVGITDVGDVDCPADFSTTFGCITGSTEIAPLTIGTADLADGSVRSSEIREDAVGSSEIAAGAVTSDKIIDESVGTSELATGAVTSAKIQTQGVVSADIADGAVGNSELAPDAVGEGELPDVWIRVISPGCADAGALTTTTRCLSSAPCGAGLFRNCSGGCTEPVPLTCFHTDIVGSALQEDILN